MDFKRILNIKEHLLENKTIKQTIFKNAFWLTVCVGVDSFLKFFLLIYTARILGVVEYGEFSFAFAFTSLFIVFSDFGLSTIITREFTEETEDPKDFSSIISLKILLSFIAFIIILFCSFFATSSPNIRSVIVILSLFSLINGFIAIFYALFSARQKMEYQALLEILQGVLIVGFGFIVLFNFPSVLNLSYGYLLASIITIICVLFLSHSKIFRLKVLWDKAVWKKFLKMSWPLTLTTLFVNIHMSIDSIMLGHWGLLEELGWYSAASRMIPVAMIPIALISGSFYPAMSSVIKQSKEKIQQIWDNQLEIIMFFIVPLIVGTIVLAPRIISFLYPAYYAPAVLALQILIVMIALMSVSLPFSDLMIVFHKQKQYFFIVFAGAIANIILNIILIPKYSLYGAAIATVISHLLVFLLLFYFTLKFVSIKISYSRLFKFFVGTIISSAVMLFLISRPQIYNLNVIFSVSLGVAIYSATFFFLKKMFMLLIPKTVNDGTR